MERIASLEDFPVASEFLVAEHEYRGDPWDHAPVESLGPVGERVKVMKRLPDPQPGMMKFRVYLVPSGVTFRE